MKCRRFNDQGVKAFAEFLDTLRADPAAPVPMELLTNPRFTEPLSVLIDVDPPESFASRMEFAKWLHTAAIASGVDIPRNDSEFWAWLSLALFDHVCPVDGKGRRKVFANPRYIVESANWQRCYRHLLMSPYELYFHHRDEPTRALVGLVNRLHVPGELSENISSRRDIIRCPGSMSLATYLCIDSEGQRRKGASGDFANEFGKSVKRVLRTWDLPMMDPSQSAKLLHRRKLRKLVNAAIAGSPSK